MTNWNCPGNVSLFSQVIKAGRPQVQVMAKAMAAPKEEPQDLKAEVCSPVKEISLLPHPQRLRTRFQWWVQHATPTICNIIQNGVEAPWPLQMGPWLSMKVRTMSSSDQTIALQLIQEYLQIGALKEIKIPSGQVPLHFSLSQGIRHLVPWFIISKP